jgi:hypothetical protein
VGGKSNWCADVEATNTAANHAHKGFVDWVELRACKLNHWLPVNSNGPILAQGQGACFGALFQQLTTHVIPSGHAWQSSRKNLRCTSCGLVLKYHSSTSMQEKAMRGCIPKGATTCLGSQLHKVLHHTHTMYHLQGGNLSKKLKEPSKVTR